MSGSIHSMLGLSRIYHWSPTSFAPFPGPPALLPLVPDQILSILGAPDPFFPFHTHTNGFENKKTISSKFSAPLLTVSTAI